ncbi:MAG: hypothetical protein U0163_19625 [Gemmatimonadaceae bacterium]
MSAEMMERAEAWLAASNAGILKPPRDVEDRAGWDEYWRNHLKVGTMEQGFSDVMSSDTTLPGLLAGRGSRTILCAGNGLSTEALSLALHGFNVTALDISTVPGEVFGRMLQNPEHSLRRIPGFSMHDDGSVTFGAAGSIDPELCPPIHRSSDYPPRRGGSLSFVTGNLIDQETCPGPFDVVIERRTVQLFPEAGRLVALDRLVARLTKRGVFVSQQHKGNWKRGDDRTHYAKTWLESHGFVIHTQTTSDESGVARLACLMFSSG